ncbi:non-ribosomal peptide synthetase, partial [Fischerella thermalis CCMEE 5273]
MGKLDKQNVEDILGLTPVQEGMLFHYLKDPRSDQYFEQLSVGVKGEMEEATFRKAWEGVVSANECLRMVFRWEKVKNPVQIILKESELELKIYNLTAYDEAERWMLLKRIKEEDRSRHFDLRNVPFRITLCKLEDEEYEMMISNHHILYDGWSNGIILNEFFNSYDSLSESAEFSIPSKKKFKDFVKYIQGLNKNNQHQYWQQYLRGFDTQTRFTTNRIEKGDEVSREDAHHIIHFPRKRVEAFLRKNECTLAALIYSVWGIVLQKNKNCDDVVFGTTVSGRPEAIHGIEQMVGLFINTIPLRVKRIPGETAVGLVKRISDDLQTRRDYDNTPLVDIKRYSELDEKTDLFDTIVVLENYPLDENLNKQNGLLHVTSYSVFEMTNYDLTLGVTLSNTLEVCFTYNHAVHDHSGIKRLADAFSLVMTDILHPMNKEIGQIEVISTVERDKILYDFNATRSKFPERETVGRLFEQQVARTPNHISLVQKERVVTYKELDAMSNSLAHVLLEKGVKKGETIGLMVGRSIEAIAGILAVLKTGCAYLPVDPSHPDSRKSYMFRDSGVRYLLTDADMTIQNEEIMASFPQGRVLKLTDERLFTGKGCRPSIESDPSDLLAVFYTSGTTGQPKGVMIENKNVVNIIHWFGRTFHITESTNILQMTDTTFDPSMEDIFGTLLHGGTLHIAEKDVILNKESFCDYIDTHHIHLINFVPTVLRNLLGHDRKLESLRTIIAGGERMDESLKTELLDKGYALYNIYGPTETTIDALYWKCTKKDSVRLGKPVSNVRCYILDSDGNLVPVGSVGEIYIAGTGVSRGYVNMAELTDEKFLPDPFVPGDRMYRTGDWGRWLSTGEVEFMGRADYQVKVRGYRIELGEIEQQLLRYDRIDEAIVIDHEDADGKKALYAYVVARQVIHIEDVRSFLAAKLPDYMVPVHIVQLEKFPLTTIGKIDRKALPIPDRTSENRYVAPRNETESVLVELWSSVLGVDRAQVGIHDNFFALGGDSILSIQIAGKAMQYGLKITVSQMFQYQTIMELARVVERKEQKGAPTEPLVSGEVLLTPIQQWFFEQDVTNVHHWNQSVLLETESHTDEGLLLQSFMTLIQHHDSFRLRYSQQNGTWKQTYTHPPDNPVLFHAHNLNGLSDEAREQTIQATIAELQYGLNITEGPMIGAALFQFEHKDQLFITVHHLVMDGYSWRIFLEDLQTAYEQLTKEGPVKLPPKSISFKEWARALYDYVDAESFTKEHTVWSEMIPSAVDPIPVDRDEGENTEGSARTVSVILGENETNRLLHHVHHAFKTRIDDILLTALSFTLKDWGSAAFIDVEGHGRRPLVEELDLSRTIGWFTCVYPVFLQEMESDIPIATAIKQVKERLRGIPNGGIGYELLYYLADTKTRESFQSRPRPQISFNYLGQFEPSKGSGQLMFRDVNTGPTRDPAGLRSHLIDIDGMIVDGALRMDWKYSINKHFPETIQQLANDYLHHLSRMIQACMEVETPQFTPSDFPLSTIGQEQLDVWCKTYDIEDIYALTPVQQSMIFHHIYSPASAVTVEQSVFTIESRLDLVAFERVWQTILDDHESLRASYHWNGLKEPVQMIHRRLKVPFEVMDWSHMNTDEKERNWEALIEKDRKTGFDLSSPPLMRITVVKQTESAYDVIWTHHHLQLDGWSAAILLNEIKHHYGVYSSGNDRKHTERPRLKEYIQWMKEQDLAQSESFWKKTLSGFQTPIRFNSIFPTKVKTGEEVAFGEVTCEVSSSTQDKMKQFAKKNRITLNSMVQGAWAILLSRYSGKRDIVFGVTSSGRPVDLEGSESIIGCLMNTLPFRVGIGRSVPVVSWLQEIQLKQAEMRQFEYTPLADIRNWSDIPRSSGLFDLYESMVIVENYPFDSALKDGFGSLHVKDLRIKEQMDYPITVYCNMEPDLHFKLLFNQQYVDETEANQMLSHLLQVIQTIVESENQVLDQIGILSDRERYQLLVDRNRTMMKYPNVCFHDCFEKKATEHPHHPAVIQEDVQLSYRELDVRSNQLAHQLIKRGIKPQTPVGVYVDRSIHMVVGILGIMKAGGAFLPIDVDYPGERVEMMLRDAQVSIVLTQADRLSSIQHFEGEALCLDTQWQKIQQEPSMKPLSSVCPKDIAYIIYTSGSSGKPKGVMMAHEAVVSHATDIIRRYRLTPEDRVLQFSSISFDISLEQVLTTLAAGATLVLRDKQIWTPLQFSQKCHQFGLTVTNLPTSYWNQIVQAWHYQPNMIPDSKLRLMVVGGEQMSSETVSLWETLPLDHILLLNAYGPAEAAMTSTLYPVSGNGHRSGGLTFIPVGKPLANRRMYILDEDMQPLPAGVKGEIYIGGIPLAQGYWNNPDLTEARFIPDPFYEGDGNRLYQTGDLGRMLADGNIEVLGRKDDQTKIRGHRIDLGEVEAILKQCDKVKDAAVVVKEEPADRALAAFYVPANPGASDSLIRQYLRKKLPEYMVPSYFVGMNQFPLNPNGKIDRKALAKMKIKPRMAEAYEKPRNEIQEKLVTIWERILEVDPVGINHHFFEIGGQSLKAMAFVSEVHREFGVQLPLVHVFEMPTIKDLSSLIEEMLQKETAFTPIHPVAEQKIYEVSAAQRRMYLVHMLGNTGTSYNIPAAVVLEGEVDVARLEKAFQQLIQRHEVLRTSFIQVEGEIYQNVHPDIPFQLELLEPDETGAEGLVERFIRPFELDRAPLFRAAIAKISSAECLLMVDMHHIVSDGLSRAILIREFFDLYQGKGLPDAPIQYKDFAAWQNQWIRTGLLEEENYWMKKFSQGVPLLELPTDYPRPDKPGMEGGEVTFHLRRDRVSRFHQIARDQGVTLYAILLAAFNVLLHKYTGQEAIVVGTPVSGRRHADVENMVGMFVNTLALRNDPKADLRMDRFVNEVAKNTLEALDHQDYPFELLVEKLDLNRDRSRHPLFDVMFAFENVDSAQADVDDFEVRPYPYENKTTKFDLECKVTEQQGGVQFVLEYSRSLFRRETVERMADHLVRILTVISKDMKVPIGEIELVGRKEKERIVDLNRTQVPYPQSLTIKQWFEKQVERDSASTAVVCGERRISFAELNEQSNRLAHHLITKGARPNAVIGMLVEPSIEMMIGLLGVIKSGAAYLPIDPETPEERVSLLLDSSHAILLLTQAHLVNAVGDKVERVILEDERWSSEASHNPEDSGRSDDILYITYTSGTTGIPKGVPIKNKSLVNYICWFTRETTIESDDKTALLSSFAFDLGYTALYSALLNGCELHVVPKTLYTVPDRLTAYLENNTISYIKLTPSLFSLLVHCRSFEESRGLQSLRWVVLGGEELKGADIAKFSDQYPAVSLMNHYGPTEATIGAIARRIPLESFDSSSQRTIIGKPIDNVKVYIMDHRLRPVPTGVIGEICIAGEGLTAGYRDRRELNDRQFVEISLWGGERVRLYKTGDWGRMNHQGEIEFCGRMDRQVKINGYRVEPEEVASVLMQHPSVNDAVVSEREGRLCAYLVLNQDMDGLEVRQSLLKRLPHYMVPSSFIQLDAIPLTPNGKINEPALLQLSDEATMEIAHEVPVDAIERQIAHIWESILEVDRVGANDHFFERGGNSLKVMLLIAEIHKQLHVEIPIRKVFQAPTVRDIANTIKHASNSTVCSLQPLPVRDQYELSSAQRRLYTLHQLEGMGTAYNMPRATLLEGSIRPETLERVFAEIVARHEVFRTCFEVVDDEPKQKILNHVQVPIEYVNLDCDEGAHPEEKWDASVQKIMERFIQPFDLSKAPLLRIKLVRLSDEKHVLLTDMHHIISDGYSVQVLMREFTDLYHGKTVLANTLQYKDFADWQNRFFQTEAAEKQEVY